MELLQNANLTNFEIFQMATANFSDFFKENYGVLKTGKDADFIILDTDLMACEPTAILKTKVLATYSGGKKVYGK